jgi:uncharacterized protein YegP (UPF0339 family)
MRFVVANNSGGAPSWWLYAGNGQMVAWSGETFASLSNAKRSAEAFKGGASTARYEVYASGAEWRWRAWHSSDKVASSGESFVSESNARRAAENLRDSAGAATLE